MTLAQIEDILTKIDAAVGPPEEETVEEHQHRREMVQRDSAARRIRKAAVRH